MFGYESLSTEDSLNSLLNRYARNRRAIQVDFRKLIPQLNSPDRATHLLHPYPAKLLMHIPFFFLANQRFSQKGDLVGDPFCGSGTVLLESQLAGRFAYGADSNPFAQLLSSVKTHPIDPNRLQKSATRLFARIPEKHKSPEPDVVNLRHWFYPHVIRQLSRISEAVFQTRSPDIQDFFKICFSNCVKRVSLADPRLAVPVRLKKSHYPTHHPFKKNNDRLLKQLRTVNVIKEFKKIVGANCRRMTKTSRVLCDRPNALVEATDARAIHSNTDNAMGCNKNSKFKLIITSPPYPGAQKYIRSCSLSLGWLGLCRSDELLSYKHLTIGREEFRKSETSEQIHTGISSADRILEKIYEINPIRATIAGTYICEMREALNKIWKSLEVGGHLVLVAANNQVAGCEFRTQEFLRCIAEETGFTTILRLIDDIRSRGLMTKRNKTASVILREWVLVFQKGIC